MLAYLSRRLLQSVIVLFIVSFVCFVIFQYLGDPIRANFGSQDITTEKAEELKQQLGLDRPFYVQYGVWISKAVQGDFGLSFRQRQPVFELLVDRFPATFELATLALLLSTTLGIMLGMWSALKPRSWFAKGSMIISLLGISMPAFVIGLLLLFFFAVLPQGIRVWQPFLEWVWLPVELQTIFPLAWWPKFPSFGRGQTVTVLGWKSGLLTADGWNHLVMPIITLGLFQVGVMARLTRSGMFEALVQDYVRTAWAKGLRASRVITKHAMRNVLIPVVTIMGLSYGELIAFSIVTESVFQWPGVGKLLLDSVFNADQPMVVAYIFLAAITILLLNLLVDVLYLFLNPKIRYD
jgi:peptide/nickel transport system permease protein